MTLLGAALARGAPPAECCLWGLEANPRGVGMQLWPRLLSGMLWERSVTGGCESVVGARGGSLRRRELATRKDFRDAKRVSPGIPRVPDTEAGSKVFAPWAREDKQWGAGPRWTPAAGSRESTKLLGSPPLGPWPCFAAALGLQGFFLSLFLSSLSLFDGWSALSVRNSA